MLFSEKLPVQYVATWAVGMIGMQGIVMPTESDILGRLFLFCQQKDQPELAELAEGALVRQPIVTRETMQPCCSVSLQEFQLVMHGYDQLKDEVTKTALLIVAWYLAAIRDEEIVKRAGELIKSSQPQPPGMFTVVQPLREILNYLGEP